MREIEVVVSLLPLTLRWRASRMAQERRAHVSPCPSMAWVCGAL